MRCVSLGHSEAADEIIAQGYLMPRRTGYFLSSPSDAVAYYTRDWDKPLAPLSQEKQKLLRDTWNYAADPSVFAQLAAHWILANPHEVAGKHVVDLAAGSGVVAVAAAMAGAAQATTIDIVGEELIRRNAHLNQVSRNLTTVSGDIFSEASQEITRRASVITLCNYFGYCDVQLQKNLLRRAQAGATIVVCASPIPGQGGWDMLQHHSTPIRPNGVSEGHFSPQASGLFAMFKVTPETVRCG
jgi:hypothetical protein